MEDISVQTIVQREKWRRAKAKWRAKAKPQKKERDSSARRHPLAKLTLDEEIFILRDYLAGDSYLTLRERYSLSDRTIYKVLLYWKTRCEERFLEFKTRDPLPDQSEELQSEEVVENSQGGFF